MRGAFPANATQVAPDDLQGIIAAAVTENTARARAELVAASPGPLQTEVPCSGPLKTEQGRQWDTSCPRHCCSPKPVPEEITLAEERGFLKSARGALSIRVLVGHSWGGGCRGVGSSLTGHLIGRRT